LATTAPPSRPTETGSCSSAWPIVRDNASGLDIVTANADGSNEQVILRFRPLEAQGKEPHHAQWSPDGARIAVTILNITARPRLGSAIYVLDADGSNLRRITPMRLNAGKPDWSPDGKRIVFNSSFEGAGRGRDLHRPAQRERAAASAPVNEPANRKFANEHLPDDQTATLLARWARWHDVRVASAVGGRRSGASSGPAIGRHASLVLVARE
jgi:dipeptidyl aminopeptidase/acylaminoacyl peptidase